MTVALGALVPAFAYVPAVVPSREGRTMTTHPGPAQPGPLEQAVSSPSEQAALPLPEQAPPSDPVQRWVRLGIITAEQGAAIRAEQVRSAAPSHLAAPPLAALGGGPAPAAAVVPVTAAEAGRPRSTSLVAEALGYLGGAIVLVAIGLTAGYFWSDLSTAVRLILAAGCALGLLVAGAAVPVAAATGERLRSVLWVIAVVLTAGFLTLFADALLDLHDSGQVLVVGAGSAVVAAFLWLRHHRLLQHLTLVTMLTVTVAAATFLLPDVPTSSAASVWALGVAWYLLGWGAVVLPGREAELIGAALAAGATAFFAAEPWGSPLGLLTLIVLATLAVCWHDLWLLVIAAVATLMVLPSIVTTYFHGMLAAASVLLVVGALLIFAGVLTLRLRPTGTPVTERPWRHGAPVQAISGAAAVVVVTAGTVLLVALL